MVIVRIAALVLLTLAFVIFTCGLRITVGVPRFLRKNPREDIGWVILIAFFLLGSFTATVAIGTSNSMAFGIVFALVAASLACIFAASNHIGGGTYFGRGWDVSIDPWGDYLVAKPVGRGRIRLRFLHFFVPDKAILTERLHLNDHTVQPYVELSLLYEGHGPVEFVRRTALFEQALGDLMQAHYHITAIQKATGIEVTRKPLAPELQAIGKRLGLEVIFHGKDPFAKPSTHQLIG